MNELMVYLAGPINGCSDEECKNWRDFVKKELGEHRTLDPMRRDYRGRETEFVDEIVEGDKADIDVSTHILVNYDRPSVGTSMEIFYAWQLKKPVIVVTSKDIKLSPWLLYHKSFIFYSFQDALEHIRNSNKAETAEITEKKINKDSIPKAVFSPSLA